MRHARLIAGASVVTFLLVGCGGGDHMAQTPPPASTQSLATAQVLAQARQPSETAAPYAVNEGALTLTDTSDETQPLPVNGT